MFLGIVDRVQNDTKEQDENFQTRLKKLANVHAQLLNHALGSFPNLERLVYSTCSSNQEENEAVVDEALSINGKFKLLDATKLLKGWTNKGKPGYDCSQMCLNAVSNIDCTNGFFIAIFVRRDFEEKEDDFEMHKEEKDNKKLIHEDFEEKTDVINLKNKSVTEQNTDEIPIIKKTKSAKRKERRTKLNEHTSKIKEEEPIVPEKTIKIKKEKKKKKHY